MKKLPPVVLSDDQTAHLQQLIRSGAAPARTQTRARALLLATQGQDDAAIAAALLCSPATVGRIRRRFTDGGLERALHDAPRPGQPPRITGEVEAHLTTLACSDPPEGQARWTLQLLADRLVVLGLLDHISDEAVRLRLKKTNLSLGGSNSGASPKRGRASSPKWKTS